VNITLAQNRIGRLRNRKIAKLRRESDLLKRDLSRDHRTTRVKRFIVRAFNKPEGT